MIFKEVRDLLSKYNFSLSHSTSSGGQHHYSINWNESNTTIATTTAPVAPVRVRHISPNFKYEEDLPEYVINRLKEIQTIMLLNTV